MKDTPPRRPASTSKRKAAAPPETPAAPKQKAAPARRRQSAPDTDTASDQPVLPGHLTWSELKTLLTRPIAYHRPFCRIAGGATAGLLLSQAFYWTLIQDHTKPEEEGWFFKTMLEWEEETGLTRTEQETARRQCRQRKLMEEKKKGIPAKLFFRLRKNNVLVALEALMQDGEFPQPSLRKTRNQGSGKAATKDGVLPQVKDTNTTTESIPKTTTVTRRKNDDDQRAAIAPADDDDLLKRMLKYGASRGQATRVLRAGRDEVRNRLDLLDRGYPAHNPGGMLCDKLDNIYGPTKEMLAAEANDQSAAAARAEHDRAQEKRRAEAEALAAQQAVDERLDYDIKNMKPAARAKLEEEAKARAKGVMGRPPTETAILMEMRAILRERLTKTIRSKPRE